MDRPVTITASSSRLVKLSMSRLNSAPYSLSYDTGSAFRSSPRKATKSGSVSGRVSQDRLEPVEALPPLCLACNGSGQQRIGGSMVRHPIVL